MNKHLFAVMLLLVEGRSNCISNNEEIQKRWEDHCNCRYKEDFENGVKVCKTWF